MSRGCARVGCVRRHYAGGLCQRDYMRARVGLPLTPIASTKRLPKLVHP